MTLDEGKMVRFTKSLVKVFDQPMGRWINQFREACDSEVYFYFIGNSSLSVSFHPSIPSSKAVLFFDDVRREKSWARLAEGWLDGERIHWWLSYQAVTSQNFSRRHMESALSVF